MTALRARRTERRSSSPVLRVTDRDLAVLHGVGRLKFATTGQLAKLAFHGSRSAANKRIRRLFDAGLIRAWAPRLDGENIYGLTPRGARLLGEPESDRSAWPTPRGLDGNIAHLLGLGSVRVAFAVTLGEIGLELSWFRSYWELEARFAEPVIPDALFQISGENGRQVFALELDRTTPSPQAFARRILNYEAMGGNGYGVSGMTVLVVGSREGWLERYRQRIAQHPIRIPVWFATFGDVEAQGAQASWRSIRGELAPSLRALLTARKGRDEGSDEIAHG
jgi:hypothetical protein